MSSAPIGTIHHVELWVPDIDRAAAQWGWLLTELGYQPFQEWTGGCSWRLADTYIVIEQSPDMLAEPHDRKRPGLNHLAFHAGDQAQVDALTAAAAENGWALMFADKHPHAGGPQTYAAYLSNTDGHEVELTASNPVELTHPQVLTIPPCVGGKGAGVRQVRLSKNSYRPVWFMGGGSSRGGVFSAREVGRSARSRTVCQMRQTTGSVSNSSGFCTC